MPKLREDFLVYLYQKSTEHNLIVTLFYYIKLNKLIFPLIIFWPISSKKQSTIFTI